MIKTNKYYGCFAAEKVPQYGSCDYDYVCCDDVMIDVPRDVEITKNMYGAKIMRLKGLGDNAWVPASDFVFTGVNGEPRVYDGTKYGLACAEI